MRQLVTGQQMKEIDRHAIEEIGIPSMVLMERAALAAADETEKAWKEKTGRGLLGAKVCIFCGTGNNGADGAAMGRIFFLRGAEVSLILAGSADRRTREMEEQLAIAARIGIPAEPFPGDVPEACDIAVDALFGVGLSREVKGVFADAIKAFCEISAGIKTAVDIPSGISSATGQVLGTAVQADLTVTFGFEKLGTVLYPGRTFAGKTIVADIGFPDFGEYEGYRYFSMEKSDLSLIPERKADSHKGTWGKVLIAAGSAGMCGAAYLSALSAYRMGAGLVKIMTVRENGPVLQTLLPEAILSLYDRETAEEEPELLKEQVENECAWAEVIALGPGLGKEPYVSRLVEYVLLSAYVPIVVDADGLNAVAEYPHLAEFLTENVIITPHLGEMSRLTGKEVPELRADLCAAAAAYSEEHGVTCVLKDAVTVIASRDGNVCLSGSGTPAMAKGGSGDVLTGILAGLLAIGMEIEDAAFLGTYIHGLAGNLAVNGRSVHSVLAGEIADCLAGLTIK